MNHKYQRSYHRKGKSAAFITFFLFFACILIANTPSALHASQPETSSATHNSQDDPDKKLENLRSAYQLFPLNEGLKRNLANAYANYGTVFFNKRQFDQADQNFLKAQELYPDDAAYSLPRGICNYYLKKYDIARYELERTRTLIPDSAEVLYYLGLVLYETDYRQQAIELWERALDLSPGNQEIINQLKKARKEVNIEASMDRGHSSRFNMTYDPGVSTTFALAVLDVLESASNQVGAELGHFPEARVPVVIYKRADFKDVTNSPDWSGGVYDGTIRLPFGTSKEVTSTLRAVLFHEYAHVVIYDLTHGNCPVWLNEGIAEMFGRGQFSAPPSDSSQTATKGTAIDFRRLEGSFTTLASVDAARAYQQSYSMVNYLVSTYGWRRVKAILEQLGKGKNIAVAIAAGLKDYSITYDGLIKEWLATQQAR